MLRKPHICLTTFAEAVYDDAEIILKTEKRNIVVTTCAGIKPVLQLLS